LPPSTDPRPPSWRWDAPPASVTIESDDCRKTVEELTSRGVEFISDVLEFPWGYVAQFQDPDGNRLQIREGR
jgi:predicted enzyme related to lactoylglutathione lyase